ncbi:unnamed protein product [Echinostoma caproni]|uniref:Transmembrane protein n=1 Tax=Echinostoma caproni TaxID=27848 RepID=A0A183ALI7_9TREM|nr:unnamed protein product [Echinostoma caproni]
MAMHHPQQQIDMPYDYSPSMGESETTSSPPMDTESKSDNGIKPVPDCSRGDQIVHNTNFNPLLAARFPKVRLNSVAEESTHTTPQSNYHSSSLSTISSVTESSGPGTQVPFASASPEAHLSKLKSIHRKVKRRKRWRRVLRVMHFIITKLLVPLMLIGSTTLLLCGYFLSVHYLLVSGCIILLAAIGFQVQLCFTERTGPNKFNPMSVPFSIPAEDLKMMESEPMKEPAPVPNPIPGSEPQREMIQQPRPSDNDAYRTSVTATDLHVRRLSLALARVANNALQAPRYPDGDSTGVLRLARRLTLASTAIGIGTHDHVMTGSSWLTGNQIRHGVRRSLAWNATGASRFYEQNYD